MQGAWNQSQPYNYGQVQAGAQQYPAWQGQGHWGQQQQPSPQQPSPQPQNFASSGLPSAVTDPSGRGIWEPQRDPKTGKTYWTNHTLQRCRKYMRFLISTVSLNEVMALSNNKSLFVTPSWTHCC